MIDVERINEIIIKHKITPTQVYILWLLYTEDEKHIEEYIDCFGQFEERDFKDLIDKGLLLHFNRSARAFRTTDLHVTLEFAEELATIDPEDAYEELFDTYPGHLLVNGKKVPAKTLQYTDEKAVRESYKKLVTKNKFIHPRVLAAVNKWKADNNGYATIKIDKFVLGKYWEEIEKEEDDGTVKPSFY